MKKLKTAMVASLMGLTVLFSTIPLQTIIGQTQETETKQIETQPEINITSNETAKVSASKPLKFKTKIKEGKYNRIYKIMKCSKKELKNYTFYSTNKKVARASKGKIVAKESGKCKIKVLKNGNLYAVISVKVKKKPVPKASYSAADLRLMSAVIFCEAGGDCYGCYAGKKAVGIVVMNRVKSNKFPNTIHDVIFQSGQFSCTGSFFNSALAKYDSGQLGDKCISAAKEVLEGSRTVDYGGTIDMSSYLFFSRYVSGARLQIEGHQFK